MDMFCRQCEQTGGGKACTSWGVCGKSPEAAVLQDLLIHGLKGIAVYGKMAREIGVKDKTVDRFLMESLFNTITNVNFDVPRLAGIVRQAYKVKEQVKKSFLEAYRQKNGNDFEGALPAAAGWVPVDTDEGLLEQGKAAGILANLHPDEDNQSLRELLLYSLKGMAAYAYHASVLGLENEKVSDFFYKGLDILVDNTLGVAQLLDLNMEFGKVNFECLEMLDKANTERFGSPVPTNVFRGVKKGPAIIVSGHDLLDLEQLLKQTENKGVNIFTHGEMLPAHGYPGLKKYKHLVGHFGSAWQNQQKEFSNIPAAILMTTNCIQKPQGSYSDRIFTTGTVGWSGVNHIEGEGEGKNFGPVIEKALTLGGFAEDESGKEILVGFGHDALEKAGVKVMAVILTGQIKRFFLIGGCDGAKPGRNYYTELAQKVPANCAIITLACGKFRFNHLEFGEVRGLPRLIDCGQCNDSYSAIAIATGLSQILHRPINSLPISMVLSWYEQKAVCILVTLLSLGIRGIRLGPSLPAFISPGVFKVLSEKFDLRSITTPDQDLREIFKT